MRTISDSGDQTIGLALIGFTKGTSYGTDTYHTGLIFLQWQKQADLIDGIRLILALG